MSPWEQFCIKYEYIVSNKIDVTDDYDIWWKLSIVLAKEMGEYGRKYYHGLCQFWPRYKYSQCDYQYNYALSRKDDYDYLTLEWLLIKLRQIMDE